MPKTTNQVKKEQAGDGWVSIAAAAARAGLSAQGMRNHVLGGDVVSRTIAGCRFVRVVDLDAWIAARGRASDTSAPST